MTTYQIDIPVATFTSDGLESAADKEKLAGIEPGATADQTGAEIVSAIDTELGGPSWQGGGGSGEGGGSVDSVFGRAGNVVAREGDYSPEQVHAVPAVSVGQPGGVASLGADGKVPAGQLPGSGFSVVIPIGLANTTISNIPAASLEFSPTARRVFMDLTNANRIYLNGNVITAANSTALLSVEYSVNGGSTTWTPTGSTLSLASAGQVVGGDVPVPEGAKTTHTWLRIVSSGGNGTADPVVSFLGINLTFPGGGTGGSPSGDFLTQAQADAQGMPAVELGAVDSGDPVREINADFTLLPATRGAHFFQLYVNISDAPKTAYPPEGYMDNVGYPSRLEPNEAALFVKRKGVLQLRRIS